MKTKILFYGLLLVILSNVADISAYKYTVKNYMDKQVTLEIGLDEYAKTKYMNPITIASGTQDTPATQEISSGNGLCLADKSRLDGKEIDVNGCKLFQPNCFNRTIEIKEDAKASKEKIKICFK